MWLVGTVDPDLGMVYFSTGNPPSRVLVASIDVPSSEQPGEDRGGADATRIARIASMQDALARQLAAQPRVRSWAFSDATPGDGRFERRGRVEGDGFPPDFPGLPVVTSLRQLMFGVMLGTGFWAIVFTRLSAIGAFQGELGVAVQSWPYVLSITAAIVVTTGLLACLAPTLRGLRIRPVEALRVDA